MTHLAFRPGAVAAVGECMVELSRGDDGRFGLAFGGDTFNTAVYLVRCGRPAEYVSRLGDDPYSAGILALAEREGVGTGSVTIATGRMPGLYLIETHGGERSFWYWRDRSPARELFEPASCEVAAVALGRAAAVYFSGVTLSLYGAAGLDAFAAAIAAAKAAGVRIVMDNNYRPRGWQGDADRARRVFERFWRLSDLAMPTFDDEQALWGDAAPADTVRRLQALGVAEIVVKNGPAGATVAEAGGTRHVPCPAVVDPVDTTAAGDSFNGAYLAARMAGAEPAAAALAGHRLAANVIRHRGAIVPRD